MVISDEVRSQISAEMEKYPEKRGALLPALHWVMAEHGHVGGEATRELAELFGILPIEIMEVISFYNMFHAEPIGKHEVRVCTNLPCALRGARTLMKQLEARLGVDAGETTDDGRITLGHEECLGACAYAPMMRVGVEYHEDLDLDKAVAILEALE